MGGVKSLSGVKSRWGKVIGGVKSRWGKVMGGVKSRWGIIGWGKIKGGVKPRWGIIGWGIVGGTKNITLRWGLSGAFSQKYIDSFIQSVFSPNRVSKKCKVQ